MNDTPYANFLAIREDKDADGNPICVMNPSDTAFGREGVMHGGAIAALLQAAGKHAVVHALKAAGNASEPTVSTVSITVDYLRPGKMTANRAIARIVKLGARVANLTVQAWNDDPKKPFATAKLTMGIQR